jgi:hypothetical protein
MLYCEAYIVQISSKSLRFLTTVVFWDVMTRVVLQVVTNVTIVDIFTAVITSYLTYIHGLCNCNYSVPTVKVIYLELNEYMTMNVE